MEMEIFISVILLFVGIAVLVFIHVCIVGRAFRAGYNNGQEMITITSRRNSQGTKRMSSEDLNLLPCFNYKAAEAKEGGGGGNSPVECVVCLENFKVGDNCRLLPNCKHSFHSQCIDSWLVKTPVCPICRTCVLPLNTSVIISEGSDEVAVDVGVEST